MYKSPLNFFYNICTMLALNTTTNHKKPLQRASKYENSKSIFGSFNWNKTNFYIHKYQMNEWQQKNSNKKKAIL